MNGEGTLPGTRRALLIGINSYPKLEPQFQLRGCVNDVEVMARILEDHFGFRSEDVTRLLDEEAAREAILQAMDDLIERTGNGDVVVIHYSGHGSQMTDREGDEPDGRDETIVPHDGGRAPNENRDITDDELYLRLQRLTDKTQNVTLLFDCCHSGTVTRDAFGTPGRWVPADDRRPEELPPSPLEAASVRGASRDLGPSGWLPVSRRYVLMAGCRDEETSAEHTVKEAEGSLTHGALTYFLSRELVRATPGTTYRDVFERAGALVSATYPRQHPQIEGTRDRELFGVHDIEPVRFVGVTARSDGEVTLAAGAAHGMVAGSEWAIHPQGAKRADASEQLGVVRIEQVRALESSATVVQERDPGAVGPGGRAVEVAHAHGEMRLSVEVVAPGGFEDAAGELRAAIERSWLARPAEEGEETDLRAYVLPPRAAAAPTDPVPQLAALAAPTWAVVGREGRLAMPPHRLDEPRVVEVLRENVETLSRHRNALALRNPNVDGPLRGRVELVLKRQATDGTWTAAEPDAGGQVVFEEGDRVAIEVVNLHTSPVYVTVLDFGLTGAVGLVHPANGPGERVDPQRRLTVGERAGEELALGIPEGFPFGREPAEGEPAGGAETFKLIATTQPADFSSLVQGGVRGLQPTDGSTSAVGELLTAALTGTGGRDVSRPTPVQAAPDADWITVERTFFLRRRG
jgi:Caspase domain